jgi:prefoldin subunit 5
MRDEIEARLQQLKDEYEAGQRMLAEIEQRKANLEQTLLRISGAIQVLEELLQGEEAASATTVPAG